MSRMNYFTERVCDVFVIILAKFGKIDSTLQKRFSESLNFVVIPCEFLIKIQFHHLIMKEFIRYQLLNRRYDEYDE